MRHWLVIGLVYWDRVIVHSDTYKIVDGIAIFETKDGESILATKMFSSILPISNDDYYSDKYKGIGELNKERK